MINCSTVPTTKYVPNVSIKECSYSLHVCFVFLPIAVSDAGPSVLLVLFSGIPDKETSTPRI